MSNRNRMSTAIASRDESTGDVIGGGVAALLGLLHLFALGVGGWAGMVLLVVAWPIAGGVTAALVERNRRSDRRELGLRGAIAGVFGAVTTGFVVLLAGVVGLWTPFILTTFGTELVPVTIAMTILFVVTWAVFGYVGGYLVREIGSRA